MAQPRILRIYLEPDQLKRARDGGFNVMNRIKTAFEWQGFRVDYMRNSVEQREKSADRNGYSLFMMQDPFHDRALNLRLAYYYPFWRIENTAERWNFRVAQKAFNLKEIDTNKAKDWANDWRKWLFNGAEIQPGCEGNVYVPLQGRLLEHRSFQACSPMEMIHATLEHDPGRHLVLGLHPGESYSEHELRMLEALSTKNPRVSLITGGMEAALQSCDYVVTQNSSAALSGFFFKKPAILYGKIDFHHIAINVSNTGEKAAFERVLGHAPDYDAFLYWFIGLNAFKADEENAGDQIIQNVRELGWDVD